MYQEFNLLVMPGPAKESTVPQVRMVRLMENSRENFDAKAENRQTVEEMRSEGLH